MKTDSYPNLKPEDLDMEHLEQYDVLTLMRARRTVLLNEWRKNQIDNNLRERNCIKDLLELEQAEHDAEIQNIIGLCYSKSLCGAKEDKKKAFEWYKKSAEQGYAVAQYNLGLCYEKGECCEKNEKKAFEWYMKSAEQGFSLGQNNLGVCYGDGKGCKKDKYKAFEWYKKAAEQEVPNAQYL